MIWRVWADQLRQTPQAAVTDLLRGAANITPFERVAPHEFLLAVLPRDSRNVRQALLGEPSAATADSDADLPDCLDQGLAAWLSTQRSAPLPAARKLSAYAAQVCEALQWPLYFQLPQSRALLHAERAQWLQWLSSLTLSAYRDPEYDYWQTLAVQQHDDQLQFFWQSFVLEAGRTRSLRYLNLGLLALARLPLSEEDSLHNLRLQVQALVNRYQRRQNWGVAAQEELADALRGVMARNPSLNAANYRAFLADMLAPLGEHKTLSVLSLLGLAKVPSKPGYTAVPGHLYKLKSVGTSEDTRQVVCGIRQSSNLATAWKVTRVFLSTHEDYVRRTGDSFDFVRALDECARALCKKYPLRDPEVRDRLFQWIYLAVRLEADNPRLWMLWALALRQADQAQRAEWVLWAMTRRFPTDRQCRLDLARLLADSNRADDQAQVQRLLGQVLQLDPNNLHAHSTLAQFAIRQRDWPTALAHAQRGLKIDPANGQCALLLATAYARSNAVDDLKTAINHLQRFVQRYPGDLIAEGYLDKLLKRQQLAEPGKPPILDDDEQPARAKTDTAPPESNAAWLSFAASLRADLAAESAVGARLLPLPQALRLAVQQGQWDSDVLANYDASVQREFPLETRVWRYLQVCSDRSERERAGQAVIKTLAAEAEAAGNDRSWPDYLDKQWQTLNHADEATVRERGAPWLTALLDRYQPLPAPLLAS